MDILEDDRQRATTLHHRIEKKWLGKLTIPFSTLILRHTVFRGLVGNQAFTVVHSEYRLKELFSWTVLVFCLATEVLWNVILSLDLRLIITLMYKFSSTWNLHLIFCHQSVKRYFQADLAILNVYSLCCQFPSNEDVLRLQLSSKWLRKLRGKFPSRNFTVIVIEIDASIPGSYTLIT